MENEDPSGQRREPMSPHSMDDVPPFDKSGAAHDTTPTPGALEHIAEVANYGAQKLNEIDPGYVTGKVAGAINSAIERFWLIARTARSGPAQQPSREPIVCPTCGGPCKLDFWGAVSVKYDENGKAHHRPYALAPGNGEVKAERTQSVNKVLHQSSFDTAWAAFQNTDIDLVADSDDETCRCLHNAISAYLASAPSPAALEPVTVEALEDALEYVEADLRERFSVSGQNLRDQIRRALIGQTARNAEPVAWRDPSRCEICDWPLADSPEKGCVPGDCSYRPDDPVEQARIRHRRDSVSSTDQTGSDK